MPRRLSPALIAALVACFVVLMPALALAADGSDTSGFEKSLSEHGILFAMGACFLAGIGGSLTPCVWPMIPITISIFGGGTEAQSRARGAALSAVYVHGIAALFVPLGVVAALTGAGMGAAMAKPFVVIAIALLFCVLAASMFGAFELGLPSWLTNRVSSVGGVGFKGAFIVGMALGLIAAPCTGPFLTGLLLWLAKSQSIVTGAFGMYAFAMGLGLPFFIAGAFAVSLPKGGAWMMGIKWGSGVVLGYMALKYLRDRWPGAFTGFMKSNVPVFAIVGLVFILVGFGAGIVHMLGERRKSKLAHLSKPLKLVSIVPAIAGLYIFFTLPEVAAKVALEKEAAAQEKLAAAAGVPVISWDKSEASGRAKATAEKKPAIVDFGASWCTACKELEEQTWPDMKVRTEAKRFVAMSVDCTDDDDKAVSDLKKKYKVVGLPTVVLLDANGEEKARFTEFVKADRMTEALKKVQ